MLPTFRQPQNMEAVGGAARARLEAHPPLPREIGDKGADERAAAAPKLGTKRDSSVEVRTSFC